MAGIIGSIIEAVKGLSGIFQFADKAELNRLQKENYSLKKKPEERNDNPLVYDGHVYRDAAKLPYCPACYDDKEKRIHLKVTLYRRTHTHLFRCPVCHAQIIENDTL